MKKSTFFILFLLLHTLVHAQFPTIAESPGFKEPETGYAKVVQLKNGNTCFLHLDEDGIDVKMYDNQHKQKADGHLKPIYGKLKGGTIDGIFALGENVVVIASETHGFKPVLYRLIIDGNTGALKQNEILWEQKETAIYAIARKLGHDLTYPQFHVRKDPYSEHYAIALMNSYLSDENKRVEIALYDADNKEISRTYYHSKGDDSYRYLNLLDFVIVDGENVCLLANKANKKASRKDKQHDLVMAYCRKGAGDIEIKELSYGRNKEVKNGLLRYNQFTKKVMSVIYGQDYPAQKGSDDATSLVTIDPATQTENEIPSRPGTIDVPGTPQDLRINRDGSYTLIYEELTEQFRAKHYAYDSHSTYGKYPTYNSHFVYITGNILVATFEAGGKERSSYVMRKKQFIRSYRMYPFVESMQPERVISLENGDQFKIFSYLEVKNGKRYMLFNDQEVNDKKQQDDSELPLVASVGICNGLYFDLGGTEQRPARQYLFDKPEKRNDYRLAIFPISVYDSENNVYALLKLDISGNHKEMRIVWISL